MNGNPEAPEGGRVPAAGPAAPAVEQTERALSGQVAEFALVAAGLGLVVYFLAFVDDVGPTSSPIVPLLLGGGLLAGSVALPTVGARVLAPAAVVTVTGALLLVHAVVSGRISAVVVGALVLALLEAGAAAGAVLLHAGVVRGRRPKPKPAPPYAGYPQQAGYPAFPGQQYPGQPYPGSYAGYPGEPYPGDQYAGEHAYAQHARYGAQYGVPGYPPPPPYGAPGYDPTVPVGGQHAAPQGPVGDQPTTVTGAEGWRSGVQVAPMSAVTASGATGSGATAAGVPAAQGSGAFRSASAYAEPSGSGASAPSTGSHAAPDPADEPKDSEDDRTRVIPAVKDER
jgi:Family of unknown function (DUF5336)